MKCLTIAIIFGLGILPSAAFAQQASQPPENLTPTEQQAWDKLTRLGNSRQFASPRQSEWNYNNQTRPSNYQGGIQGVDDRICQSMAKYGMPCSNQQTSPPPLTPSSFGEKSNSKTGLPIPTSPIDPKKIPEPESLLALGAAGIGGRLLRR